MICSMTGYGRSEGAIGETAVVAEIRSTNHKYCDIVVRVPKSLIPRETALKKLIQEGFTRGRFELTVALNGAADRTKRLDLDLELAERYYRVLNDLKAKLGLPGSVDLNLLANFREIISVEEESPVDQLAERVEGLVKEAMARLAEMRRKEGSALARDLGKRITLIEKTLSQITRRVPRMVSSYRDRLKKRVTQLARDIKLDPSRLVQEVTIFAERSDISEEMTRMHSHLRQFKAMLRKDEPVGRSLDFLIQEMNREVNTIGSKASDATIAMAVVGAKTELEKVREQVQNIE